MGPRVGPSMGPSGPLWAPPFGAFDRSLAAAETWDGPGRAGAVGARWAPAAGTGQARAGDPPGAWEQHHDRRHNRERHSSRLAPHRPSAAGRADGPVGGGPVT